ncbi:hypothetical protein [Nannocystis radixulma]|uniref:Uncharacterized protein n=1 Tax=Nannocystis radixulma TaxID=2995305 RepID=A0ABT5B404_9BACT|nr:hypothetical protein [Nannocystis radixulma]MDC0668825.1 hypothetical protein [Nannocystis radixulma]
MQLPTRLVVFPLVAACHAQMPETEVVHGELVDYHYSLGLELCGGTVASWDATARRAGELLDLPEEGLKRVAYYWLTEADYAAIWADGSRCATALGCAIGLRSAGHQSMSTHEIVHTIANQWNGSAAPFLAEGFADAVIDGRMEERDPRPYLTLDRSEITAGYWVASRFVRYLLQVHGAERFAALYRGVPGVSELDDWDEAVRASYGMSLDALVEEYLAATECPSDLPSLPRLECDAPALTADPAGNFVWTNSLRCDDPEVVGGMQPPDEPILIGDTHLELRRTFEVVEAGEYEIAVVTPEGEGTRGQVVIAECDGCAWLRGYNATLEASMTKTHWLEPGRYSVVLRGWIEAETVEFRATRQ